MMSPFRNARETLLATPFVVDDSVLRPSESRYTVTPTSSPIGATIDATPVLVNTRLPSASM